jgi:hypothetical protein
MSTISYERDEGQWQTEEHDSMLAPGRPRRRWFGKGGTVVLALVLGACGFYAGVRVEKGQVSGGSAVSGLSLPSSAGSRSGPGASNTGRAGAGTSRNGFSGVPPGGAAGFGGAGDASVGTVSSVRGSTVYLTTTSGNTVKVKLSSATKITKSQTVRRGSLRPGDTIIVQGVTASNGSVSASSVSDSGASTSSSSRSTSGSSGSGSAVSSLFGSGSAG